jgi:hypothetical protein
MFKKKKKQTNSSVVDKVLKGEMSVEEAQKVLSVKELENGLLDQEHGVRDHSNLVDLRKWWGRVILGVLLTTIAGDFILVWMVGTGTWKFESNGGFLNVVATEHLVQIFGLVLIVLKSLFPKKQD